LEVDYGSDDDDDDESVADQQNVLDTLEPAALIQDALDAAQDYGDGTVIQDIQPKAEDVEDFVLAGDSNTSILADKQDMMDIDEAALDVSMLKATSRDPILGSNPASRGGDVELFSAQAKLSSKTSIYAPLRDHIAYSDDAKLVLGLDDFHNLVDAALPPPSDLLSIFPDLQPLGLFDIPSVIVPSTNEGKKRSEKRLERDDPTRRSEDTTYTKLFPSGEFMHSKPTLLGPLHPSKYFEDGQWVMEETPVFPDSDSSTKISENTLSGRHSSAANYMHY
jgi:chromatin modification-related protein VID21